MMQSYTRVKKEISFLSVCFLLLFSTTNLNGQNCTVNAGIPRKFCANETIQLFGAVQGLPQAGTLLWTQVAGPSAIISNPNILNPTIIGAVGGSVYTFRISSRCVDGSFVFNDVNYTILETPVATASGGGPAACPGNSYSITGNTPNPGESGLWSLTPAGTGVSIDNVSDPNTFVTLSPGAGGVATLRWTVTNLTTNCAAISNPITVTNCGGTTPVSAGPDQSLDFCYLLTTSTTLSGSSPGFSGCGQAGMWTVVSGPNVPNIGSASSTSTGVSNLVEGTYVFRWTVTGPCASGTDLVTVTVPAPRGTVTGASISSPAGTTFCDMRSSVTLYGSSPNLINENVQWVQTGGPAVTIVSPTSPVTAINGFTSPGTYTFSYTITNPVIGCSSGASVSLSFGVAPTVSITPDLINLPCSQTYVDIPYTQTGVGSTSWRFLSGPGISSPTAYQAVASGSPYMINGLVSGVYVIEFRRQAATGNECPISTDVVTVVTSGLGALANAGTDQLLACNVFETMLAGNDPSLGGGLGIGTWYQIAGPNTANIEDIHAFDTDIDGLINGQYIFRWVISDGTFCNPNQDDVIVRVANINPEVVTAGMDETYCFGTIIQLMGNTPALNEIGTWTVFPNAGVMIADIHAPNTTVTGLTSNTAYTFTWTIVNSCAQGSDEVIINTNATEGPIQANAGANQCLPLGTTSATMAANATMGGVGNWALVSGPNVPVITNPASPTTTITGLINGNYIFEWSITKGVGCNPTRDSLFVTIADDVTPAMAGEDLSVCGTSVFLNANTPIVGTGTWTQPFGPGGAVIVSPNNPNTEITGMLANASYTFRWTISNDACTSSFDEMIVATSSPADAPNAGADLSLCGGTSLMLNAMPVTYGYWTVVSGPNSPNFSNINSPTATVSNLIMGTYVLRWNSVGGSFCPTLSDEMTIFVVPTANAGPDQFFCEVVTTVNLTGNAASTGVWTQVSGPSATITPTGLNTAVATSLMPGVYTFRYTINTPVEMNPCTSFDDMTVVLLDPPTVSDAGPDQQLCNQTTFTLAGNTPVFGTGTWTLLSTSPSGLTGSFTNPNNPGTTFTGTQPGIYIFEWTIANDECTNADRIRIDNYPAPSAANAGADFTNCGTTGMLNGNNPVSGVGNWTFITKPSGAADPQILNPILYNSPLAGLEPGIYEFQWTISSGPACTPSTDIVQVTVVANPTLANAGMDISLCPMTLPASTILNGNTVTVGTGMWTVQSGPTGSSFVNAADPMTAINGLQLGTYVLRWTTTNGVCVTFDEMTLVVSQQPTTADASATATNLCIFEGVNLIGNTPVNGTGLWTWTAKPPGSPNPFILNPANPATSVFGIVTGTYTFRWTISSPGCSDSFDEVNITINPIPSQAQILMGTQNVCVTDGPLALLANQPMGSETGTWTLLAGLSAGTATINNPNSYNTATVSGFSVSGSPAVYALSWTLNVGPCASSDTIYINVWDEPTASNAGADQDLCNASTFSLMGNTPATGIGVWTKVSGPAGTVTSPFSPSTTVTGTVPGTYVFRWRISNGTACMPSTDELTIINRPAMTTPGPADISVCAGASPTLTVVPGGGSGSYSYQWESSATVCPGSSWTTIGGATSDTYNPGALTTGTYTYRVIVTDVNGICAPVASRCVTVTVVNDPAITVQPAATTDICRGANPSLSVTTSGGTPSLVHQWQYSPDGIMWNNVVNGTPVGITYTNATTTTLNIATDNTTAAIGAHRYRLMVSAAGLDCNIVFSNEAIINVYADPAISSQPASTSICSNTSTMLSVTATGNVPPGTLMYQWQMSTSFGGTYNNISGANSSTYTTPVLTTTTYYRVIITQTQSGCSTTSSVATVTVNPIPTVTSASTSTICNNINVNYIITSGVPGTTFTWTAAITSTPAGGTINGITASGSGNISDVLMNTGTSSGVVTYTITPTGPDPTNCVGMNFTFAVTVRPTPTVMVMDQTICSGQALNIPFTTTVPGTTFFFPAPTVTGSITGGTARNSPGNTNPITNTLTQLTAAVHTATYTVTPVINSCNGTPIMVVATVNPVPVVTAGLTQTLCADATFQATSNLALTTTPNMAGATFTYAAPVMTGGMTGGTARPVGSSANITDTFINNTNTAQTATYQVIPQAPSGLGSCTGVARTVVITVQPRPLINSTLTRTLCEGPFTYTITSNVAGSSFAWSRAAVPGITPATGSGATASISENLVNTTNAPIDVQYVLTPTGPAPSNCPGTPSTLTVTVYPDPFIIDQPQDAIVCLNTSHMLSVNAGGGTPGLVYQWEVSSTGCAGPWSNAPGVSNMSTYTTPNLSQDMFYRVQISASGTSCDLITSNCVTLSVPRISVQPAEDLICSGGTSSLSVTMAGTSTATITYQWQVSSIDCVDGFSNISGATNSTYNTPVLTADRYYRVIVSIANPTCSNIISDCAFVNVAGDPVITTQPNGATICEGNTHSMSVGVIGNPLTYAYQWQQSTSSTGPWSPAAGTNNQINYTTPNLATTMYYRVNIVDNASGCDFITSNVATVNVLPQPGITAQPASASICTGGTENLLVIAGGGTGTFTYQWQTSPVGAGTWTNVPGATNNNYLAGPLTMSADYRVIISQSGAGCNALTSNTATITVFSDPFIAQEPSNAEVCTGNTANLSVTVSGGTGTTTYQWQSSAIGCSGPWANIPGATNANYTTVALTATTYYRVIINQAAPGCGSLTSACGIVTVYNNPTAANAGPDQTLSGNTTTTMAGNNPATGTGTWTQISGPNTATIVNPNLYNTQINNIIGGDYVFRWTVTNGVCPISFDDMMISNEATLTIMVNAVCINDVPYVQYEVIADNFPPSLPFTIEWYDANNILVETSILNSLTGQVLWPGAAVDMSGNGTDWPGWIYDPMTGWAEGADGFEDTRPQVTARFIVNPTEDVVLNYPPATPACASEPPIPRIGTSKELTALVNNFDGTANASFEIFIENIGNRDLEMIQITEDLDAVFGAGNYTVLNLSASGVNINPAFNGSSNMNLLNSITSQLAKGASALVNIDIRVLSPGAYVNTVRASGIHTVSGLTAEDDSQDGDDPDPDGMGPEMNNDPTPLNFDLNPIIGLSKNLVDVINNGDGSYNVSYEFVVRNYGDVQVDSITVTDDLMAAFAAPCSVEIVTLTASGLSVNPAYDGAADINLLLYTSPAPLTNTLSVGEEQSIQLTIRVMDCDGTGPFNNNADAEGRTPYDLVVTDESVNGTDPDLTPDGNPNNDMSPTPVNFDCLLVAQTEVGHINCFGADNGTAIVNAIGGSGNYSFLWSTTATTQFISGLAPGAYSVTVTDENGCTAVANATITEPAQLVVSISASTNINCFGLNTGSAAVTASGGTGLISFLWSNGSTDQTNSNLIAGNYILTVTDLNGCTASTNVTITQPASALTSSITASTNPSCEGNTSGTATVTGAGGTGMYTYLWSNGQTTATATGLTAGTYLVTVTDANGCTSVSSVLLTDPTGITATITASTNNPCFGDDLGTATVTGTGGTGTFTYLWSTSAGSQTTMTATALPAGQHSVTVSDGNGCSAVAVVNITEPTQMIAQIIQTSDITCNGLTNGTATVNATGGTTNYTYLWPASAGSQTTATANNLGVGTYIVTVTDAGGCTSTASATISEPTDVTAIATVVNQVNCFGQSTGTATVTPGGGVSPYTYLWSNGSTDITAMNLPAGMYTVTVFDSNGCTETSGVTITQPASALTSSITASTNPSCEGNTSGTATVTGAGGTGMYTYLWSNGQTTATATGLTAGTYLVTVTDANGCTSVSSVLLTDPTGITATITASTNNPCFGDDLGTATVTGTGGTGTFTYLWSASASNQTTMTATALPAGQHSVTVSDGNGCSAVAVVNITEPTQLIAQIIQTSDITCNGLTNGTATVNATGGTTNYTYLWPASAGSQTTATANNLGVGTYIVTVTDAGGCTSTASATISEPTDVTAIATVVNQVNCFGQSTGTATVTPGGGVSPYTYLWSNGSTDITATNLPAGMYTVTVFDANGCTETSGVTITQPASALTSSITASTNPSCEGNTSGTATVTGAGGTGMYTYLWSNGQTTATATGLTAGTYLVTVTDANGCTSVSSVLLTDPTGITATITASTNNPCFGDDLGTATVTGTGGTGTFTYLWSASASNQTTMTATALPAGQHSVTVSDGNGCSAVAVVNITEPTLLISSITASTDISCDGASTGSATVTATGGTTPYTYLWSLSAGSQTTQTAIGLVAGMHTVTVTDANSCTSTAIVTISSSGALTINPLANIGPMCLNQDVPDILLSSNPNNPDVSYSWTGGTVAGLTDGTSSGLNPFIPGFTTGSNFGTTTVTVEATLDGCTSTTTFDIIISDTEDPTFVNCAEGTTFTVGLFSQACEGGAIWSIPIASDNCGAVVTQTNGPTPGTILGVGTYTIQYTATDAASNTATCNFVVEVIDSEDPAIVCPSNVVINQTDPDLCTWTAPAGSLTPLLAGSNCPANITYVITGSTTASGTDDASGETFNLGTSTVTYTITETASGQTWECSFTVTINDHQSPAIACPSNIIQSTDAGVCIAEIILPVPVVSDNCSLNANLQINYRVFGPDNSIAGPFSSASNTYSFTVGISQIEWTVMDEAGNSNTCLQTVTIIEDENPVITCPAGTPFTFSNTAGECGYIVPGTALDATATDNCGTVNVTHNYGAWGNPNSLEGASFPVGTTIVVWTAVDASGNTSTCSISITVEDDEDPTFVNCPNNVTYTIGVDDNCGNGVIWSIPIAQDNCEVTVTQTDGPAQGLQLVPGTYPIQYTATDMAGNTSTCNFTIVVVDEANPLLVCLPSFTIGTADGVCSWTSATNQLNPLLAVDNCPSQVLTYAITGATTASGTGVVPPTVFNIGTSSITYTLTDGVNTVECSFTITVVDDESPQINSAFCGVTTNLNTEPGTCTNTVTRNLGTVVSDNCTVDNNIGYEFVVLDQNGLLTTYTTRVITHTFELGINITTLTVTDEAGNTSSCSSVFIVHDNQNPVITCAAGSPLTFSNTVGECGYIVPGTALDATATDNCGTVNVTHNYGAWGNPNSLEGASFPVGTTIVVWTAVDASGNTSTCSISITVEDDEDPTFVNCPNNVTYTIGVDDNCGNGVIWSIPIAQDNCEVTVTQTDGPAQGLQLVPGTYPIQYTATDMAGNTSSCNFTIVVVDEANPLLVCLPSFTIGTADGVCSWTSATNQLNPLLAVDNCPSQVLTYAITGATTASGTGVVPPTVFNIGTSSITYTLTDGVNTVECSFTITVVDDESPQINSAFCGVTTNLNTEPGTCTNTVTRNLGTVVSDNCTVDNNIGYEFVVLDQNGLLTTYTTRVITHTFELGINITTLTVTDEAGNTSSCSSVFIVNDNQNPIITCPVGSPFVYMNTVGECGYIVPDSGIDATATDNCNIVSITHNYGAWGNPNSLEGATFPAGTTTVIWTAVDQSGNISTCSYEVTVDDDQIPAFVNCLDGDTLTISLMPGACVGSTVWSIPIASDNCTPIMVTQTAGPAPGTLLAPGIYRIEYTAGDPSLNTITCEFFINVVDTQDPVVVCPANVIINETDSGACTWTSPAGSLTPLLAVANCPFDVTWAVENPDASISGGTTDVSGYIFAAGVSTVTYTITEPLSGQTWTCSFTVTIIDDQAPEIDCPSDLTLECNDSNVEQDILDWIATATGTDNCGSDVSITASIFSSNSQCGLSESRLYQFVATDLSGNTSVCFATVHILDTTGPVISGGENQVVECILGGAGNDNDFLSWLNNRGGAVATDGCGGLIHWSNDFHANNWVDGCNNIRFIDVTFTATDECGNSSSLTLRFGNQDSTPPVFLNCPRPDIVVKSNAGMCGNFVNFSLPIAVDNCDLLPVITKVDQTGLTSGDFFPIGKTTLVWEAEDCMGNITICEIHIYVNDDNPPSITCAPAVTVDNGSGECGAVVTGLDPVVSDLCPDNLSLIYAIEYPAESGNIIESGLGSASGLLFNGGISTVHYKVQDQPLLLITEATHALNSINGGTSPIPGFIQAASGDDYLEITNFGPAAFDISCLAIERISNLGIPENESFMVPAATILQAGEVLILHFGPGTDVPANYYFNLPDALDLNPNEPSAYVISLKGRVIDVVALNGFDPEGQGTLAIVSDSDWNGTIPVLSNQGSVQRNRVWDTNAAADWDISNVAYPASIGSYNVQFPAAVSNGATTSLQHQVPNQATCTTEVHVLDTDAPVCGSLEANEYLANGSLPMPIVTGIVNTNLLNILDAFEVGKVSVALEGNYSSLADLTFRLTSPSGTQVILFGAVCSNINSFDLILDDRAEHTIGNVPCIWMTNGTRFLPQSPLSAFEGELSTGIWALEVINQGSSGSGELIAWTLILSERQSYQQSDVNLNNLVDQCYAPFSWIHPEVFDNCPSGGSVTVTYTSPDNIIVPNSGAVIPGSAANAQFWVGTTLVEYTISDAAGNLSTCGFTVNVSDVADPVITCPADMLVQLGSGECNTAVGFLAGLMDNCGGTTFSSVPENGSVFEIGTTTVVVTATDASGNTSTCSFNITVQALQNPQPLACAGLLNFSLPPGCNAEITPALCLVGNSYACFDDMQIVLRDENGNILPNSPFVDETNIGQTISATIYDPATGTTCTSQINIEYKLVPEITCPDDVTIACNQDIDPVFTGSVEIQSCVLDAHIIYEDELEEFAECEVNRAVIARTWTVVDRLGRSSSCVQQIFVKTFDLADVNFPSHFDNVDNPAFSCVEVAANPALTHPNNTGKPDINGLSVTGIHYCESSLNYTDDIYDICGNAYEILRTWRVRSMCLPIIEGVNPRTFVQIIKVLDKTPPVWNCPGDITVSTDPFTCKTTWVAEDHIPEINDACGGIFNIQIIKPRAFDRYEMGNHTIKYIATDSCGNKSTCNVNLIVRDEIYPTPVCETVRVVSLGTDCTAKIAADAFDDGSFDNCGIVRMEVARMLPSNCYAPAGSALVFRDSVSFCCEDIRATEDQRRVMFRVTDESGNSNTCMIRVEVQDKLLPTLVAPPDITVDCRLTFDIDSTTLSGLFGTVVTGSQSRREIPVPNVFVSARQSDVCNRNMNYPGNVPGAPAIFLDGQAYDNCYPLNAGFPAECGMTVRSAFTHQIDCGVGLIIRTFIVTDAAGNTAACTQTVSLINQAPFNEYNGPGIVKVGNGPDAGFYRVHRQVRLPNGELSSSYPDYPIGHFEMSTLLGDPTNAAGIDGKIRGRIRPVLPAYDTRYDIIWPADLEIDICEEGTHPDSLAANPKYIIGSRPYIVRQDHCSNIGITYDQWDFDFDAGCNTIIRKWKVIDWCQQASVLNPWTWDQVIKVISTQGPEVQAGPYEFCFQGECETISQRFPLIAYAQDLCSTGEQIRWDWEVYPYNDIDQTIRYSGPVLRGDSIIVSEVFPVNRHDEESHVIKFTAEDGCGNKTVHFTTFRINDCKKPSPVCHSGLSADLDPVTATIRLHANYWDAGSFDNCTIRPDLRFRVERLSSGNGSTLPAPRDSVIVFDCDDLGRVDVRLWVGDESDNWDFCETFIYIQNNMGAPCTSVQDVEVAGKINNAYNADAVEFVSVNAHSAGIHSFSTGSVLDGTYKLPLPAYNTYTLVPFRNDNPKNGVSTTDILMVQRHILGETIITNPYKLIAADTDHNGLINALDLVDMRRVILDKSDMFKNNTSWRFVESAYQFVQPSKAQAEAFPESRKVSPLLIPMANQDFVAVKIGDINGDALSNSESLAGLDTRNARTFELLTDDIFLRKGKEYEIVFRTTSADDIRGLQFTMNAHPDVLEYKGVLPASMDMKDDNIGLKHLKTGQILSSWHTIQPVVSEDESGLFKMKFRALRNMRLSDVLEINSDIIKSEAILDDLQTLPVRLSFTPGSGLAEEAFALYQNEPNPFNLETTIRFTLPESMNASINFYNTSGKVIYAIEGNFKSGVNQVSLLKAQLPASGVIYYQLEAGDFKASKKMLIID